MLSPEFDQLPDLRGFVTIRVAMSVCHRFRVRAYRVYNYIYNTTSENSFKCWLALLFHNSTPLDTRPNRIFLFITIRSFVVFFCVCCNINCVSTFLLMVAVAMASSHKSST